MTTTHRRPLGFTLIELLVVVAIIALLVSILLPSLGRAKDLAMTIVCSSRHQGAFKGWAYYGNQYGVWLAGWDRPWEPGGSPLLEWENSNCYHRQWPYIMGTYAAGYSIPSGEAINHPGGWYRPQGRVSGPYNVIKAKQLQCAVMEGRPDTNPWWKELTTLSYFSMGAWRNPTTGEWEYGACYYPQPEKMTHPSTTGLLMCQAGDSDEGHTNCFVHYGPDFFAIDPHMGESNVTFSDGHTETLAHADLYETMWMSMWERGDQIDHDPLN
ncbi:MAG: pilus assembly FimT family protein [Planctomycetota bacterium]